MFCSLLENENFLKNMNANQIGVSLLPPTPSTPSAELTDWVSMLLIQQGLHAVLSRCVPASTPTTTDYRDSLEHTFVVDVTAEPISIVVGTATTPPPSRRHAAHPTDGIARFIEYGPKALDALRAKAPEGTVEKLREGCMTPVATWKVSQTQGKGGSFFISFGDFMLKSVKPEEWKNLKEKKFFSALGEYMLQGGPSRLPVLLGLFRIKWNHSCYSQRFILCDNVLASVRDVPFRYDLKGSSVGRTVGASLSSPRGVKGTPLLMKDNDLPRTKALLQLAPEVSVELQRQCRADAMFLAQHNIVDYSLFVGVQNSADGPLVSADGQESYYLGIIDILQPFNTKKKYENITKGALGYDLKEISIVPAPQYAERFSAMVVAISS